MTSCLARGSLIWPKTQGGLCVPFPPLAYTPPCNPHALAPVSFHFCLQLGQIPCSARVLPPPHWAVPPGVAPSWLQCCPAVQHLKTTASCCCPVCPCCGGWASRACSCRYGWKWKSAVPWAELVGSYVVTLWQRHCLLSGWFRGFPLYVSSFSVTSVGVVVLLLCWLMPVSVSNY